MYPLQFQAGEVHGYMWAHHANNRVRRDTQNTNFHVSEETKNVLKFNFEILTITIASILLNIFLILYIYLHSCINRKTVVEPDSVQISLVKDQFNCCI